MKLNWTVFIAVAVALAVPALVGPQPLSAQDSKDMAKTLQVFYRQVAARYEFILEDGQVAAEIEDKPIMSWTGQESGTVSGDVFVWIRNGRPEVVGCIGSLPGRGTDRGVFHEFHSLTTAKSIATVDLLTGRKWSPKSAGIKPALVPDSKKPAATPARRLTQMRQIAREFEARMRVDSQASGKSGEGFGKEKLRLLPSPLYRHEVESIKKHATVVDGAIFTYVWPRGTDPELILIVEAQKTDEGLQYVYAPVRMTYRELWLDHKGKPVWHHAGGHGRTTYTEPYVTEFDRNYTMDEVKQLNAAK